MIQPALARVKAGGGVVQHAGEEEVEAVPRAAGPGADGNRGALGI